MKTHLLVKRDQVVLNRMIPEYYLNLLDQLRVLEKEEIQLVQLGQSNHQSIKAMRMLLQ